MKKDFTIETPAGEILSGFFFLEGRIGLYDHDNKLIAIVPNDLEELAVFGKVRSAGHIRARLILERGTSSPDPYGAL